MKRYYGAGNNRKSLGDEVNELISRGFDGARLPLRGTETDVLAYLDNLAESTTWRNFLPQRLTGCNIPNLVKSGVGGVTE